MEVNSSGCSPPQHPRVQARDLPGAEVAAVIHHGTFTTINQAYEAVLKWIEENGYQINGPCREIYLQPPAEIGDQNDPDTVTEVQFPVAKR